MSIGKILIPPEISIIKLSNFIRNKINVLFKARKSRFYVNSTTRVRIFNIYYIQFNFNIYCATTIYNLGGGEYDVPYIFQKFVIMK